MKRPMLFAVLAILLLSCSPASSDPIAFRADLGGVSYDNFSPDVYTPVPWAAPTINVGGRFVDGAWTPVAPGESPRPILCGGQLWIYQHALGGADNQPNYVGKVHVYGPDGHFRRGICAGIGTPGYFPNSAVISLPPCVELAQPGETLRMEVWVTDVLARLNGDRAHTWWGCTTVGE